jgi:nucleoside-diphosphate-sugar epimerase
MKILIIGAGGFVGTYLTENLSKKHEVYPLYKDTIDLLDTVTVATLLESIKVDIVINCLTFGGKEKVNENSSEDVSNNLAMFYNFYTNQHLYTKYINIGSGIEKSKNNSAYAFSKRAISNIVKGNNKFITLRLYGCFGKGESDFRLLKKFLASTEPLKIADRQFDYFSIQDFGNVVKYVVNEIQTGDERFCSYDIDCVYGQKMWLSEFLDYFCDINNIEKNFVVDSHASEPYIGDARTIVKLQNTGLRLYGLAHGLKVYI